MQNNSNKQHRVAVLGLGAMGSRMASKLIENGYHVTVWARTTPDASHPVIQAGANLALTPSEAVKNAQFVIVMVRDDEASQRVWLAPEDGALVALADTAIAIDSSTLSPQFVTGLSESFKQAGRAFLHAPVVGSRPQAEAASLIYLVGGDADILARTNEILSILGSTIYHLGSVQDAAVFKLSVNALLGVQVSVLAELVGLAGQHDISPRQFLNILTAMPTCSPAMKGSAQLMLENNFAPLFPVELVEKDLGYLTGLAVNQANDLPVSQAARQVFIEATQMGYGQENLTAVLKLYKS